MTTLTQAEQNYFSTELKKALKHNGNTAACKRGAKALDKLLEKPKMKMQTNVMTQRAMMAQAHKTARDNYQLANMMGASKTYRQCLSQAMKDMHASIRQGKTTVVTRMSPTLRGLLTHNKRAYVRFELPSGTKVVVMRRFKAHQQVLVRVDYGSGTMHQQVLWLKTLTADRLQMALNRIADKGKLLTNEADKQVARVKYKLVLELRACVATYEKRFK